MGLASRLWGSLTSRCRAHFGCTSASWSRGCACTCSDAPSKGWAGTCTSSGPGLCRAGTLAAVGGTAAPRRRRAAQARRGDPMICRTASAGLGGRYHQFLQLELWPAQQARRLSRPSWPG